MIGDLQGGELEAIAAENLRREFITDRAPAMLHVGQFASGRARGAPHDDVFALDLEPCTLDGGTTRGNVEGKAQRIVNDSGQRSGPHVDRNDAYVAQADRLGLGELDQVYCDGQLMHGVRCAMVV
jgi:hypothetical protein